MHVHQEIVSVRTPGAGLVLVTPLVERVVSRSGIVTGTCTVFIQHTSASLVVQENADPAVLRDLGRWLDELAPRDSRWEHDDEGPDDMPAHARAAITRTSEVLPVGGGRLLLGTWQGLYLWEHRDRAHQRQLVATVVGTRGPAGS